jgi:hypothetical protein
MTNSNQPTKTTQPQNGHAADFNRSTPTAPEREKLIPCALEAEQSTLGAQIIERSAITKAREKNLNAEQFYREPHRKIQRVIDDLYSQEIPVDLTTLADELRTRGQLDEIGGAAYLTALLEACPSAANIEAYIEPVQKAAADRALIFAAEKLSEAGYSRDADEQIAAIRLFQEAQDKRIATQSSRFIIKASEVIESQPALVHRAKGILYEDSLAMLVAAYGCYKTFIALSLAYACSLGLDWFGHETQQCPVLYVATEGARAIGKRVRALRIRYQQPTDNLFFLTEPVDLGNGDVDLLIAEIKKMPVLPGLIVFDTLERCMSGNPDSTQDMQAAVAGADKVRRATSATILIVHHVNKSGEIKSNNALMNALDTIIQTKITSAANRQMQVFCHKQREEEFFAPINLVGRVVELGEGETSLIFDGDEMPPAKATEADEKTQVMLEVLERLIKSHPAGVRAGKWQEECMKNDIGRSTFYDKIKKLDNTIFDEIALSQGLYKPSPN